MLLRNLNALLRFSAFNEESRSGKEGLAALVPSITSPADNRIEI